MADILTAREELHAYVLGLTYGADQSVIRSLDDLGERIQVEAAAGMTLPAGDTLAQALHDWRKTQSLAGCGWVFGSVVDGEVLCPCPADALAILALCEGSQ